MTDKTTLVFDLTVNRGSLSLYSGGEHLARMRMEEMANSSERFLPGLQELLNNLGLNPSDLKEVVCTRGPGGYTGIRVGLAFARGLARAIGSRIFGYPLYEVLLFAVPGVETSASVIDAGRTEILLTNRNKGLDHAIIGKNTLSGHLAANGIDTIVSATANASELIDNVGVSGIEVIDASDNVTELLNRFHLERLGEGSSLDPIYGRDLVDGLQ